MTFVETSNEEQDEKRRSSANVPFTDRIGVLDTSDLRAHMAISHDFMDVLWDAALAKDGVVRVITLTVQRQGGEDSWAIFDVQLSEGITDEFELRYDKEGKPQSSPPRADPVVVACKAVRTQLRVLVGCSIFIAMILVGW